MTVIVVRDGVLACDTQVNGNETRCGEVRKWAKVHPDLGGGFVAFAGGLGEAAAALTAMADRQIDGFKADAGIWLRDDGTVLEKYGEEGWFEYKAPFYAIGSGECIALGALHMGATAQQAVEAAIAISQTCGGRVDVAG